MKKYVIDLDKDIKKESKTTTKIYAFVSSGNIYSDPINFSDKKYPEYYRGYNLNLAKKRN